MNDDLNPVATPPAPPTLSARRKITFALLVPVLVTASAELACRFLGLGKAVDVAHYVSDWHKTPDGRTFWVVRGRGYNSDGMRDRQHTVAKPPGVHRIVCLGDSVTVGRGIRPSQAYPFILESYLGQMGLNAEVINVAASGWSTRQETTAYTAIARKYRPDHVFLGFCLNDVAEMKNNLAEPPPILVAKLMRYSALARFMVNAEQRQVRSVEQLFSEPNAKAVRAGWRLVFEDLRRLRDDTRADGCDLSVVIFPFRFQFEPGAPDAVAQRTLLDYCLRNGIPCLDLLDALGPLGSDAFIDESHLSPAGAQRVAEALIDWGRSGCVMCGFDLTGHTSDACPRCGAKTAP